MTNDSKLFPPRPKWEAQGYRPDEYSRWLKGDWRPIAELWRELKVDPSKVVPIDAECARRIDALDVQKTDRPGRLRCAQPPYDRLPIPRADIPAGIILSRDADQWIRAEGIEDVALPLYEGRMIGQFDFSEKGWVGGKGRSAKWADMSWAAKEIHPQFCMAYSDYSSAVDRQGQPKAVRGTKLAFMDVTAATNQRTMIAAVIHDVPAGNSAPVLGNDAPWSLSLILNSIAYDFVARRRCAGLHLNWFVIEESPLPLSSATGQALERIAIQLGGGHVCAAHDWAERRELRGRSLRAQWAITLAARARCWAIADALAFLAFSCDQSSARAVLEDCDRSSPKEDSDPTGFWRVDKESEPELRRTVLSLVAAADLEKTIRAAGADTLSGIESFLGQSEGAGWQLPERLRLADYGLGQDERAMEPQPVASRLGPRFCDWQLAQSADESWRECEIHAANLREVGTGSRNGAAPLGGATPRGTDGRAGLF
jgi:hypothetical protein